MQVEVGYRADRARVTSLLKQVKSNYYLLSQPTLVQRLATMECTDIKLS